MSCSHMFPEKLSLGRLQKHATTEPFFCIMDSPNILNMTYCLWPYAQKRPGNAKKTLNKIFKKKYMYIRI